MNEAILEAVAKELKSSLVGRRFCKIFQLSRLSFAIDLNLPQYLFISVEPNLPRIYLIKRKLRELEKACLSLSNFALFLRKRLLNAIVKDVLKLPDERILKLTFVAPENPEFPEQEYSLIVQLTGRSANLFLLDANDIILASVRENKGEGQVPGTKFAPPQMQKPAKRNLSIENITSETISESLDEYYQRLEKEKAFQEQAKIAKNLIKKELTKKLSKLNKLRQELEASENAPLWKKYGELIMANLDQIVEVDGKFLIIDYFDENLPTIEVDAEGSLSPKELAERFFKLYSKAKRANEEIKKQLTVLEKEIEKWKLYEAEIERAISEKDELSLQNFLKGNWKATADKSTTESVNRKDKISSFARRFVSSDGFEILVGKAARDNDYLTFRFANSSDFWFHAADYPGSHVIVRNPNRLSMLPYQTLIEAAEIAAFFSQGKNQQKAAVNYTQKKFVHKPRSAPPGLVSLSKFKTIIVEPKIKTNSLSL